MFFNKQVGLLENETKGICKSKIKLNPSETTLGNKNIKNYYYTVSYNYKDKNKKDFLSKYYAETINQFNKSLLKNKI